MAKHRSYRRRHTSKSKTMRRSQMGGELAGNPPSAWGWIRYCWKWLDSIYEFIDFTTWSKYGNCSK